VAREGKLNRRKTDKRKTAEARSRRPSSQATDPPTGQESGEVESGSPFPIVAIGASAGGLEAFGQLLHTLPTDTDMAFVLISHLDPTHPSMLGEILGRTTAMPVAEVANEMPVEANHVYVNAPGVALRLVRGIFRVSPRRETRGQHRPIDEFLRSLAEEQGYRAIGVVLSGTGTDGTLGLEAIKAEGGVTFAQDDTAQHKGMPQSAAAAGCVDFVLPPGQIAREIARISRHPLVAPSDEQPLPEEPILAEILEHLHLAMGLDFSGYKRSTLFRRILRRAVLHKMDGLKEYLRLLRNNPSEVEALYHDVLISVTSFFRNPESFEVLKSRVFPALTKDRSRHDPVRIWSIGCSTGEEAYSLAIAFTEFMDTARVRVPVQIFATDVNGAGVDKARAGLYPRSIAQDVSPERLRRFFMETDGSYRISKAIRDTTVFASHNVLANPPFSRIDLISCRNFLIYLEPALQEKVIALARYALKPHGFLWLGGSETLGSYRDAFEVVEAKHKVYAKNAVPTRPAMQIFPDHSSPHTRPDGLRATAAAASTEVQREADRVLLTRYAPASVLVGADLEILQFRGDTSAYLSPSPGRASLNLLKMLREGLVVGVRGALHKAGREELPVRQEGLRVKSAGGSRDVNVEVIPVRGNRAVTGLCYLVLFEEAEGAQQGRPGLEPPAVRGAGGARGAKGRASATRETDRIAQELAATREYLQSVIEQQEAANEELQASNEEVQSANEELQSVNEELETSKEEVESTNEELATVNEELQNRNLELTQSNSDFVNLLASVHLAIVMLGPDLRIRRFTPLAEKIFNLIAADVGRPISDIQLGIGVPNLHELLVEVVDTVSVKELEVRDREGRWHILRLRPYRTVDNRIDGVVVVLIDVDQLKRDQETQRRQSELLEQTEEPIFMWELSGGIAYWNRGAEVSYGFTRSEALGHRSYELLSTSPPLSAYLDVLQRDGHWTGELTHVGRDGQRVVVESRMVLERIADRTPLVFQTDHVITERKRMEETLRQRAEQLLAADRSKDQFLAMLAHELRNPLATFSNALEIVRQPGLDPAMVDRAREIMGHQVQNLSRLVEDLLDVSRMTQGRIELRKEPLELVSLVEQAMEANRHLLETRGHTLTLSLPSARVYLDADVFRLEQILANLLSNAAKFTERGGQVSLTVEAPSLDEVAIRVKDSGIGMAPEHLARVFDLFMQADPSSNRAAGGLGIGLTLVRYLVELHGGSVEAHSAGAGQGSEFVVRLPALREPPRELERAARVEPTRKSAHRRVLVIDDNVDGAEALAVVLRRAGHEVRSAHSGRDALEIARDFRPEVVFLDVGMPGMDGYETAGRLRAMAGLESALLVALTGYGQPSDRRHAHEAGFDEFLVKPATPDAIVALASRARACHTLPGQDAAADS
jgi:two-component system CheB/CheR fusion protein